MFDGGWHCVGKLLIVVLLWSVRVVTAVDSCVVCGGGGSVEGCLISQVWVFRVRVFAW